MPTAELQVFKSVEEWLAEGKLRFGEDFMKWKFVCPVCGNVASVAEFKKAGAKDANNATQECIGRWSGGTDVRDAFDGATTKRPCNYAGYGLFRLSPVRVIQPDGHETHSFAFAEKE